MNTHTHKQPAHNTVQLTHSPLFELRFRPLHNPAGPSQRIPRYHLKTRYAHHEARGRGVATRPSPPVAFQPAPNRPSSTIPSTCVLLRCTYGPSSCPLESRRDVLGSSFPRSSKVTFDSFFDTRPLALRPRAASTLKTALAVLSELAMAFSFRCVKR